MVVLVVVVMVVVAREEINPVNQSERVKEAEA